MHDDGFHEIQLNGKQLVFLFMAATVVSVVIFLCGVLVGRGVRTGRGLPENATPAVADLRPADVTGSVDTPPPAAEDPTTAAPPPAVDELSYFNRLERSGPAPEDSKITEPAAAPVSAKAADPVPDAAPQAKPASAKPASAPAPSKPAPSRPASSEPTPPVAAQAAAPAPGAASGSGFTLQVAALKDRGEANAMAEKLTAKGYVAYVVPPAAGAPQVFRVRVGRYATRGEAESMATRLQREEQFTPWITR
jgi:DedD protein